MLKENLFNSSSQYTPGIFLKGLMAIKIDPIGRNWKDGGGGEMMMNDE